MDWSSYDFSKIPFDDIVKLGQRNLLYRDLFNVSWLLGRYCNYKCSYCWPYARSDEKDHRPLGILLKTMTEIKTQARANGFNSFHFSFSGGEPTLHSGYLDLLKFYSDDGANTNYQSCHMTSNLSPGLGWFKKYAEATRDLNRVSVTASWHREFADPKAFRDKMIFLQENDIQATINMVMVPTNFDALFDEAMFFHEAGVNVTLKPQSNTSATKVVEGYTEEMLKKLHNGLPQRNYTKARLEKMGKKSERPKANFAVRNKDDLERGKKFGAPQEMQVELIDKDGKHWYMDQAERFNAFEFNKFTGWKCNAGFQGIVIREPDGYIKRSYSCHDEPIGHIERGFKIFTEPKECITASCVSSVDSKIPKCREI
jgi:MoaA/NifB/PqqE/SkfB family radical SAM enzyme